MSSAAYPPSTLMDMLTSAAVDHANRGVRYLDGNGAEDFQTYADLFREARIYLAGFYNAGIHHGDRVIFQLDRQRDFITCFWACVLGGMIPVPLSVPIHYSRENASTEKLLNAHRFLDSPRVLIRTGLAPGIRGIEEGSTELADRILTVEQLQGGEPSCRLHNAEPDDIALLLLTSGSTGRPKAVTQTHGALVYLASATRRSNGFDENEVTLNWFPLDHVGGIVMFHIRDVHLGCHQIHAPTDAVLQDPIRWLEWIEQYRASITWAPNFAFALINSLAGRVQQRDWDLSSMKFILNAGEAIVARTARSFLSLLTAHGLPATAMRPAWGMSETCSAVTYSDKFNLDSTSNGDLFVEVGEPLPGTSVRIVDLRGEPVPDGTTGLLQIQGPSVTRGYFRNPGITAECFAAGGWFITGDLGVMRGGALTITGREKDVIVLNGIVYHPHEVEAVIERVPGVDASYTAVVGTREPGHDSESVVAFFHSALDGDENILALIKEIRGAVARSSGIAITRLVPVEKADIPKTEIGKIQRAILRKRFESGEFAGVLDRLSAVHQRREAAKQRKETKVRSRSEQIIHEAWKKVLGVGYIAPDDNFFEIGGTSLKGIQLIAELEAALDRKIPAIWLYERPTIAAMSRADSPDDRIIDAGRTRGQRRRQLRVRATIRAAKPGHQEINHG